MVNQDQTQTRVESSIEVSMKLIRAMLHQHPNVLSENDFMLIESCFKMVADGSVLDDLDRQKKNKKTEYYELSNTI